MIMLWHGPVASIPSGWAFCDGTQGTPDLRNRFICCAEKDDAGEAKATLTSFLATSGGWRSHGHEFTGDGHAHSLGSGTSLCNAGAPNVFDHNTNTIPATGITDPEWHVPLAYVLAYIMKL
ncbi:MAG: hypothetical protein WBB22_16215 [Anaerolineae bacterium]